jgi:predicted NAD/FAD-binding protein
VKIAIIGAGGAGLTSAWLLQADHDVTLYEQAERVGGHVHSVAYTHGHRQGHAELGFEFFFHQGYSGLLALIERLGLVPIHETLPLTLIFDDGRNVVLPPLRPRALATCMSRKTLRSLYWFGRFAMASEAVARTHDWSLSVQGLIERSGIPRDAADDLIIPLIASSWGMPRALAVELSAYSVVRVMGIRAAHLPNTFRLERGMSSYTNRLLEDSPRVLLRRATPVTRIVRTAEGLVVHDEHAQHTYDAVVLACDWSTSARLCADSPHLDAWRRAFERFEGHDVRIAIHEDVSLMPADRRLWQKGNYFLTQAQQPRTTLWAGQVSGAPLFRSWLRPGEPEPRGTSHVANYRHIVITPHHDVRQAALARLQGSEGLWAAGMYTTGVDNHESALRSGLLVARKLAPQAERVHWLAANISP